MSDERLLHLLTEEEARALPSTGAYSPPSLAKEGFVHLCLESQVDGVRRRFFAGRGVVALVLDPAKLGAKVVFEDSYGHGAFPHLYGPLPMEAVVERREL